MPLGRHFRSGCSWNLTTLFCVCVCVYLNVTGEGRKGIPAIIGRGRRGPIIHAACYLTQHYWLTVKPELGCISKTSATTWPLFTTEPSFAESQTGSEGRKRSTTLVQQHWTEPRTMLKHRPLNHRNGNGPVLRLSTSSRVFYTGQKGVLKGTWVCCIPLPHLTITCRTFLLNVICCTCIWDGRT